jgi:hypothetical protein
MAPRKIKPCIKKTDAPLDDTLWSNVMSNGKFAVGFFLVACTLTFCIRTMNWPLVADASIMHYTAFLIAHGFRPYRDILDPNMMGTYLIDWMVTHTLGAGALGSRLYDLLLLLSAGLAMTVIAWHRSRFAALYAACLFALFHSRDGMLQVGQRDLAIAAGLLWAIAFAALLLRRDRLHWAFALGFTIGSIATIKPNGLLALALLIPLWALLPRARRVRTLLVALAGLLVPLLVLAAYLVHFGLLQPFFFALLVLVPMHVHLGFPGLWYLIQWCLTPSLIVLSALCLLAIGTMPLSGKHIERLLLLIGIAIGLTAYFAQMKGFPYHRYPLVACLFLLASLELTEAAKYTGSSRWIGVIGLIFGTVLAPIYMLHALRLKWPNDMEIALQHDLATVGGSALSGQIQCIDSIDGCSRVLYDMRLMQSTGMIYDEYLFVSHATPEILHHREAFLQAMEKTEPRVIVITPDLFPAGLGNYKKLLMWPEFNRFLSNCYDQKIERAFPHGVATEPGYRLYEAAASCRV